MASLAPYNITLGGTDYPAKYAGLLAYIEPFLTNLETFSFSGGNVGLGTSSPITRLEVSGAFGTSTTGITLSNSTSFNASNIARFDFRANNSFGGLERIAAIWALNPNAVANNGGALVFGTSADGTATTPTERARITSGGEFYIAGTTDQGAYNLQVNGTGVWGAGAYVNGSDERLKEDITTIDAALDVVNILRPVTFRYKETHSKDQSVQPGFIAQELQIAMAGKAYVDGVVHSGPEYLNVAYQSLIPLLTKAIQEQQALITDLRARVAALEQA
jgi:hypothetical protein